MRTVSWLLLLALLSVLPSYVSADQLRDDPLPVNLQVVLDSAQPLQHPRHGRLPMYVLPISGRLSGLDDAQAEQVLRELDARGIGYTVDWARSADDDAAGEDAAGDGSVGEESLAEALRIGAMQQRLGLDVAVNATSCLYSFFDGSEETLHVDDDGHRFAETSFGGELGCPFAIEHRTDVIRARVESFLRAYRERGVAIDFIFADWEVDGPIEWNDAWASSKRCRHCREQVPGIDDFRVFQQTLRTLRSEMQRAAFGDNVTASFPEALVGNYGVYPHGGLRYWYDYFEHEAEGVPYVEDGAARYREWPHEFAGTGYTFAMPVVYTWYPTFAWYDFADTDYRWFYNMLLAGSNAGEHTPAATPVIPFVHWHTTDPPEMPDTTVRQMSAARYQELLWHLLLRGHDTFFVWCDATELAEEVGLAHEVYADSLAHAGFLDRGEAVTFDVPRQPDSVVSGLRLGDRVLARRTDFGDAGDGYNNNVVVALGSDEQISVAARDGTQIVNVDRRPVAGGVLHDGQRVRFPLGFYELPKDDADLERMAAAGVNIVLCHNRDDLDRAATAGVMGWMPLGVQGGATDALRERIESVVDQPALAVWEGPEEIIWTFTAYSSLEKSAGFTREDWYAQRPKATRYAEGKAAEIMPKIAAGIALVRELDERQRPFWINEAADSDMRYARQYMDSIDITGCDYYAVRSEGTDLPSVGRMVDRWHAIGRGRPVWMVLQAFSWHVAKRGRTRLYPSFAESRFMAYDSLVHGARGLMYWGSTEIDEPRFRTSLYALTAELARLGDYLLAAEHNGVGAVTVLDVFEPQGLGVRASLRRHGNQWLLILVNEDAHRHLGVDVTGLDALEGRRLVELYGDDEVTVEHGGMTARLQGFEVKVYTTDRGLETPQRQGRDFVDNAAGK
jgi:hypothetical protein